MAGRVILVNNPLGKYEINHFAAISRAERCARECRHHRGGRPRCFYPSAWPDLIVGLGIVAMNADVAREVFTVARKENAKSSALDPVRSHDTR
jgi:hypothetical protein